VLEKRGKKEQQIVNEKKRGRKRDRDSTIEQEKGKRISEEELHFKEVEKGEAFTEKPSLHIKRKEGAHLDREKKDRRVHLWISIDITGKGEDKRSPEKVSIPFLRREDQQQQRGGV